MLYRNPLIMAKGSLRKLVLTNLIIIHHCQYLILYSSAKVHREKNLTNIYFQKVQLHSKSRTRIMDSWTHNLSPKNATCHKDKNSSL